MTLPYNFSPGPAMLPPEVLEQIRTDLPEWHWHGVGQGASVMEVSHRGKAFEAQLAEAEANPQELLAPPPIRGLTSDPGTCNLQPVDLQAVFVGAP